jgi:hypothetical protein
MHKHLLHPWLWLIALLILSSLSLVRANPALAATYRDWIAQQPDQLHVVPNPRARVWVNSDTVLGETAGLEYLVNGTSTDIQCSYDTGYPGANWHCDIPGQPINTYVRYQLFTYNQQGQAYGFTGFNWSYTVADIHWNGLLHDTINTSYRSPFGAQPTNSQVTLTFRSERFNLNAVTLRVYQLNPDHETNTVLNLNAPYSSNDGAYDYWQTTVTLPNYPTVWYYKWMLQRGNDGPDGGLTDWYSDDYADDSDNLHQGGTGTPAHSEPFDSFQISVYDPGFQTPAWLQNAVIYHIFPDRFRNGDRTNDPDMNPRTFYGNIPATYHTTWNEPPEDGRVTGFYNRDFFGGDLLGVQYNNWIGGANGGVSGGTYRVNRLANTDAQLSFMGNSIDWVTATGPQMGIANVYMDGNLVQTVDLYAPTLTAQVHARLCFTFCATSWD